MNATITNLYQIPTPALIEQKVDWDKYPLVITTTQKSTMKFQSVMSIINGNSKSPSDLINLKSDRIIHPVIYLIDNEYFKSMDTYKEGLLIASDKDLQVIKDLKEDYKSTVSKVSTYASIGIGCVGSLSSAGFGALTGAFAGPLGAGIGGLIGFFGGLLSGEVVATKMIENHIAVEGSTHRLAGLKEIDTLEKIRLERIKTQISGCCIPITKQLIELDKHNQVCLKQLESLSQLQQIFESTFPDLSLKVKTENGEIDVKKILIDLNSKYL